MNENVRPENMERITTKVLADAFIAEQIAAVRAQVGNKKVLLGIYMYDFPNYRMVPLDLMELQCNVALKLLKEKRIEGIIILGNGQMGMGMESELWMRDWVKKVKNIELD